MNKTGRMHDYYMHGTQFMFAEEDLRKVSKGDAEAVKMQSAPLLLLLAKSCRLFVNALACIDGQSEQGTMTEVFKRLSPLVRDDIDQETAEVLERYQPLLADEVYASEKALFAMPYKPNVVRSLHDAVLNLSGWDEKRPLAN